MESANACCVIHSFLSSRFFLPPSTFFSDRVGENYVKCVNVNPEGFSFGWNQNRTDNTFSNSRTTFRTGVLEADKSFVIDPPVCAGTFSMFTAQIGKHSTPRNLGNQEKRETSVRRSGDEGMKRMWNELGEVLRGIEDLATWKAHIRWWSTKWSNTFSLDKYDAMWWESNAKQWGKWCN